MKQFLKLLSVGGFIAGLASAGTVTFTCDANIDAAVAGTCNTLNTTIAGIYSSAFTNANASIHIEYGVTGLGQSVQFLNFVSYNAYRSALIAASSGDAVDVGAIASLPVSEPALYAGGSVNVTSALGTTLGLSGMTGIDVDQNSCALGNAGCYNALITIADPGLLPGGQSYFYRSGSQDPLAYDFYSIVQHETNEVLGSASCINTTNPFTDGCGLSRPSAVDLFRYKPGGTLVLIDSTAGAYFSYDGGATNGAAGAIYNTGFGGDYADFASNCAFVQDATGCLGGSFDNSAAEQNILDAVGYNTNAAAATPEPGTIVLFSAGLAFVVYSRRRRKA